MGPHLPACTRIGVDGQPVHPMTCTCSFVLDQHARRLTSLRRRQARQRERGPVVTMGQVQALVDDLARFRHARRFAEADAVRQQLRDYGVVVEMTANTTRWKVLGGHAVSDYAGWEF